MDQILKLDNVDQYNSLYGLETLHPLVSVVNLTKATNMVNHIQMNYGLYALFLKQTKSCNIKYGRTSYDYEEGTIVCFAPGQTAGVDTIEDEIAPQVYGIVFHPDLIHGTALGKSIKNYTFFSYAVNEALHLSEQERGIVMDCLEKISIELEHAIDKHSKPLIAMNIELLLNYCMRFYERQFISRSNANRDALTKFEQLLGDYFQSKLPMHDGLPSVKYFADKICLSSNYFGDMVKKETGKTYVAYLTEVRLDKAVELLNKTDDKTYVIAAKVGYQEQNYFSYVFKKRFGISPTKYRGTQNG